VGIKIVYGLLTTPIDVFSLGASGGGG